MDSGEVFRLLKNVLPGEQKPCEYCHMVNRNKGVAESLHDAVAGRATEKKIEYPFFSIQIIDNTGKGISSKGFKSKFCPNCGRKLDD